ncbi:MAG: ABC transporter ATP-binding protein [Firmicutes bacterium]|nr:ABC transporter ATP-binding protein [Bacillota bacterium]
MIGSSAPISDAATNNTRSSLVMDKITAGYHADQWVLNGVSLRAEPERVTVVLGPNGAGKSTVLKVLYGLVAPHAGSVRVGDQDITRLPPEARLALGLAYLPQGHSVFPSLTVQENLEMGLWIYRHDRARREEALERCFAEYPVLKDLRAKLAGSLSGGQQRLLEVARLMLPNPTVLLIDEPSVGVAPNLVDILYEHIVRWRNQGKTVLLVDQNVEAAVSIADYVYTLESGRNRLDGPRDEFEGRLREVVGQWLRLDVLP